MKIAQITDLHLTADGKPTPDGIDVWANLKWALETIKALSPDLLVITGDICLEGGEERTYEHFKQFVDQYKLNYKVIPGNHDSNQMIADIWGYPKGAMLFDSVLVPTTLYYPECLVHLWDSSLGKIQKNWFYGLSETELNLVFVHHPVLKGASAFMDAFYPITEDVQTDLHNNQIPCPPGTYFFHGHYHCEAFLQFGNLQSFITPSLYYQIDTFSLNLKKDFSSIGFRIIEIDSFRTVVSKIIWQKCNGKFVKVD